MLTRIFAALQDFWNSLPHPVQALITAFFGGASAAAIHYVSEPGSCYTLDCIRHVLPTFLAAGAVTARAFYMQPNSPKPPHGPA